MFCLGWYVIYVYIILMLMLTPRLLFTPLHCLSTSPVPYWWFRLLSVLWLLWRSYRHHSNWWVYWTTGKWKGWEGDKFCDRSTCQWSFSPADLCDVCMSQCCRQQACVLSFECACNFVCVWVCVSCPCVCFMGLPAKYHLLCVVLLFVVLLHSTHLPPFGVKATSKFWF